MGSFLSCAFVVCCDGENGSGVDWIVIELGLVNR